MCGAYYFYYYAIPTALGADIQYLFLLLCNGSAVGVVCFISNLLLLCNGSTVN